MLHKLGYPSFGIILATLKVSTAFRIILTFINMIFRLILPDICSTWNVMYLPLIIIYIMIVFREKLRRCLRWLENWDKIVARYVNIAIIIDTIYKIRNNTCLKEHTNQRILIQEENSMGLNFYGKSLNLSRVFSVYCT